MTEFINTLSLIQIFYIVMTLSFMVAINQFAYSFGWYSFISLPSTFAHEMTHFLLALLTNGKPEDMNIVPHRKTQGLKEYWVLGFVSFYPKWYNGSLIALAPLFLIFPVIFLFNQVSILTLFPYSIISAYLLIGSLPSTTDLNIAIRYPFWLILLSILIYNMFNF